MVQRKVPNKIGIKPHHLKLDTQLVNLRPSSPSSSSQTNEKMKKIMKKSRPIKRSDESRSSSPPSKKKKIPLLHIDDPGSIYATPEKKQTNIRSKIPLVTTPQKQSPNYMKSTSSFEARKEQSPKTPTNESAYAAKGSRTSSIKMMRTLTKTTHSFKPLRSSKKVILREDINAQRATCSSTLKDSKFLNYLQLDPGGTELDGTSAMKVCPYTYCSLNGHHHHAPVPPLKSFISARRRALKIQKGFKVGCLSPRHVTPGVKKPDVNEESVDPELLPSHTELTPDVIERDGVPALPLLSFQHEAPGSFPLFTNSETVILAPEKVDLKEENKDFFVDIDWEEGYCSDSGKDGFKLQENEGGVHEDQIRKTSVEQLYDELQELYDEESVSSGAWSEEEGDSASDRSFEVSSTAPELDINNETDEPQCVNLPITDQNIGYQQEESSVPDFSDKLKDGPDKNHTTIIYNIIQLNISVFINGEKTEHSETDKTVRMQMPAATSVAAEQMETQETVEEQVMCNDDDVVSEMNANIIQDNPEQECNEYEASVQTNSMDDITNSDEITSEMDVKTTSFCKKNASGDELLEPSVNLRDLTGNKKPSEDIDDDSWEFNPRGPNFLPETPDPDAETVDLKHQMVDERKNAEEWMVDFALQQAVTTLAPARKQKVALLVEAFEKVMPDPIPTYGTHNRHTTKAFTNSRTVQACS